MRRFHHRTARRTAAVLLALAVPVAACSQPEGTAAVSTIAISEIESELDVIELVSNADPLPTGDVVQVVECSEALDEAGARRRAGTLERPGRRDIDPDTVVIDHIEIDDTVAGPDERPLFDQFPAPDQVTAAELNDRTLVFLVQLCRGDDR